MHLQELPTRAPKALSKEEGKQQFERLKEELDELQNLFAASRKHSLLVVIQGMDASGKDGLIRDVFGSLNPQGISVKSFKAPSAEELSHDFLWRVYRELPAKGEVRIFNRSHYEEVIVPQLNGMLSNEALQQRYDIINAFEQHLVQSGTQVLKCYMHVSEEKQVERLNERKANPRKFWKHNEADWETVKHRNRHIELYDDIFKKCSIVPWNVIPADQNWYKSLSCALLLRDLLAGLDMQYPALQL